jgi:hypothetical protein
VNTAVSQLDQMTQQNAALVEESAAAAQSLKDQAHRLADVVQLFKLDAAMAAPASARMHSAASAKPPVKANTAAKPAAQPVTAPVAQAPGKPKPPATAVDAGAPRRIEPVATAARGGDEGEWESF